MTLTPPRGRDFTRLNKKAVCGAVISSSDLIDGYQVTDFIGVPKEISFGWLRINSPLLSRLARRDVSRTLLKRKRLNYFC